MQRLVQDFISPTKSAVKKLLLAKCQIEMKIDKQLREKILAKRYSNAYLGTNTISERINFFKIMFLKSTPVSGCLPVKDFFRDTAIGGGGGVIMGRNTCREPTASKGYD